MNLFYRNKNILCLLTLTAVYCISTACTFDIQKSSQTRNLSPDLLSGETEELVAGNCAFAFDLYRQCLIEDNSSNLFYSPLSISMALAMTYAGAKNDTETQMATALHFTLPQDRLHNAFNALDLALLNPGKTGDPNGFQLMISNATWGQTGYTFLDGYLDILALNYGAAIHLLDFQNSPDTARTVINRWVSLNTAFKINHLLPPNAITALTRLVLTNAIYFKADWQAPFEKAYTRDRPFFLPDGSPVAVPFMEQVHHFNYYAVEGDVAAIELPYQGETVSMLVLLPAEGTFHHFESSLDKTRIDTIVSGLEEREVHLSFPAFSFEWGASLVTLFKQLGMTDAFAHADFSGINGETNLYISDIFHKAFISVDEKGTEAAAATAVIVGETAVPGPDVILTVDHPFVLLIREKTTGTILFLGRVTDPR